MMIKVYEDRSNMVKEEYKNIVLHRVLNIVGVDLADEGVY